MKRLAILRHAKTEPYGSTDSDFDRALVERGWRDARRVGEAMRERGLQFDLALASNARRVRETVEGLMEAFCDTLDVQFEQRIYEADAGTLKALLRQLSDDLGSVLVVGHNPTVQQLVLDLTDRDERGLRDVVRMKYPTATLALIDLPAETWKAIGPGSLIDLILPGELPE
jgi:phosphohistidine phosphatase